MSRLVILFLVACVRANYDATIELVDNIVKHERQILRTQIILDPSLPIEDDDASGFMESLFQYIEATSVPASMKKYLAKHYSIFFFKLWRTQTVGNILKEEILELVDGDIKMDIIPQKHESLHKKVVSLQNESFDFAVSFRKYDAGYMKYRTFLLETTFKANPFTFTANPHSDNSVNSERDLSREAQYLTDVVGFFQSSLSSRRIMDRYYLDDFLFSKSFNLMPNPLTLSKWFIQLPIRGFDYIIAKVFTICTVSTFHGNTTPAFYVKSYFYKKGKQKDNESRCYIKWAKAYAEAGNFNTDAETDELIEKILVAFKNMNRALRKLRKIKLSSNQNLTLNDLILCAIKPEKVLSDSLVNWYEYVMIPACAYVASENIYSTLGGMERFASHYLDVPRPHICLGLIESFNENRSKLGKLMSFLNNEYLGGNIDEKKRFTFIALYSEYFVRTLQSINVKECVMTEHFSIDINIINSIKDYNSDYGPFAKLFWHLIMGPMMSLKLTQARKINADNANKNNAIHHTNFLTVKKMNELFIKRVDYHTLGKFDKLKIIKDAKRHANTKERTYNTPYNKLAAFKRFEREYIDNQDGNSKSSKLTTDTEVYRLQMENFKKLILAFKSDHCEGTVFECIETKTNEFMEYIAEEINTRILKINRAEMRMTDEEL